MEPLQGSQDFLLPFFVRPSGRAETEPFHVLLFARSSTYQHVRSSLAKTFIPQVASSFDAPAATQDFSDRIVNLRYLENDKYVIIDSDDTWKTAVECVVERDYMQKWALGSWRPMLLLLDVLPPAPDTENLGTAIVRTVENGEKSVSSAEGKLQASGASAFRDEESYGHAASPTSSEIDPEEFLNRFCMEHPQHRESGSEGSPLEFLHKYRSSSETPPQISNQGPASKTGPNIIPLGRPLSEAEMTSLIEHEERFEEKQKGRRASKARRSERRLREKVLGLSRGTLTPGPGFTLLDRGFEEGEDIEDGMDLDQSVPPRAGGMMEIGYPRKETGFGSYPPEHLDGKRDLHAYPDLWRADIIARENSRGENKSVMGDRTGDSGLKDPAPRLPTMHPDRRDAFLRSGSPQGLATAMVKYKPFSEESSASRRDTDVLHSNLGRLADIYRPSAKGSSSSVKGKIQIPPKSQSGGRYHPYSGRDVNLKTDAHSRYHGSPGHSSHSIDSWSSGATKVNMKDWRGVRRPNLAVERWSRNSMALTSLRPRQEYGKSAEKGQKGTKLLLSVATRFPFESEWCNCELPHYQDSTSYPKPLKIRFRQVPEGVEIFFLTRFRPVPQGITGFGDDPNGEVHVKFSLDLKDVTVSKHPEENSVAVEFWSSWTSSGTRHSAFNLQKLHHGSELAAVLETLEGVAGLHETSRHGRPENSPKGCWVRFTFGDFWGMCDYLRGWGIKEKNPASHQKRPAELVQRRLRDDSGRLSRRDDHTIMRASN